MFKHHRFPKSIILQAVYFKLRFTLSYRDVEELMSIRGIKVDHSTKHNFRVFNFYQKLQKPIGFSLMRQNPEPRTHNLYCN